MGESADGGSSSGGVLREVACERERQAVDRRRAAPSGGTCKKPVAGLSGAGPPMPKSEGGLILEKREGLYFQVRSLPWEEEASSPLFRGRSSPFIGRVAGLPVM